MSSTKLCPNTQMHTLAHTKRSWSSRPIFSLAVQIKYSWPHWPDSSCWEDATGVTSDDKVHLWEVGIGVKSGNCCPILEQLSTYSVSQEGSLCHKKSIKSTSNYPGNWQWNWKSLWPRRQPQPPTCSAPRLLLCDSSTFAVVMKVLSKTPEWTHNVLMTLFARITFIVSL